MAALEQHKYRNPLEVLISEENRTCKGCKHELKATAFGTTLWICTKKDAKDRRRNHGKRCKDYQDRGSA